MTAIASSSYRRIFSATGPSDRTALAKQIKEAAPGMGAQDRELIRKGLLGNQGYDALKAIFEDIGKRLSRQNDRELLRQLRAVRTLVERQERRRSLQEPWTVDQFEATLRWMCENGDEDDLWLLRQVRRQPAFTSDTVERLLELADRRICDRVYEPNRVVQQGEETLQRHQEEWVKQYTGQFIAICRGAVVDHDTDRDRLLRRLINAQKEEGRFRAYVVEVGAPVYQARGPSGRSQRARLAAASDLVAGARQ